MPRILIADDEWVTRVEIEEMLTDLGYEVVGQAETGAEAIDMVRSLEPDLIIMDVMMPGEMNGIDAARVIKAELGTPIIFITGYGDPEYIEAAKEIAPFGYVMKPFDEKEIHASVEIALSKRELELKLMKAHEGLERANLILQEEIASRKKTEKELRESEKLYRDIFEKNKAIKWVLDPSTGKIIDANSAACEFYQYSYEEMTKLYLWDINLLGEAEMKKFIASAKFEEQTEFTFKHRKASGEIRTVQIYTGTVESGGKRLLHSIIVDITDRHRAEEALQESEKKFSTLFQASPVYMSFSTLDEGRFLEVNDAFTKITGYAREEVLGRTPAEIGLLPNPEKRLPFVKLIQEHGGFDQEEIEFRTKNGDSLFGLWSAERIELEGRECLVNALIDISERKCVDSKLKENEEKYRLLADNITDNIWILDLGTLSFSYVSPSVIGITGYSAEEATGLQLQDVLTPLSMELAVKTLSEELSEESRNPDPSRSRILELEQYHKNGTTVWTEISMRFIHDAEGRPSSILGVTRDISERKKAEEEIQETRREWENIFQAIGHPTLILDGDHRLIHANAATEKATGKPEKDLIGKRCYELFHNTDKPPEGCPHERVLNSRLPETIAMEIEALGGSFLVSCSPILDEKGCIKKMIHIATDITERKQAEEALIESEKKYKTLIEAVPDMVWEFDEDEIFTFCSQSYKEILGYEPGELVGKSAYSIMLEPNSDKVRDEFGKIKRERRPFRDLLNYNLTKNGQLRCLLSSGAPIINENGDFKGYRGIDKDITEYKSTEEALKESQEKYKQILVNVLVGVNQVNLDGKFIFANQKMMEMFGYSSYEELEAIGSIAELYVRPEERSKIVNEIMSKGFINDEFEYKHKDGRNIWIKLHARKTRNKEGAIILEGLMEDVTAVKNMKAQLQQSQKMEAVGTLAGGIAHDFNNILAVILGNTELASFDVPDSNPAAKSLKAIHQASIRAKDMVQQLLAFSRKNDEKSRPFNMTPIIKESMKMLRSAIPTSVEFKQHLSGDLCNVLGDATQINQIVMNLVTNAAHAMSEEGGLLEVTLENIALQEEKSCFDWVLSPGEYIRLKVRDTGEGIEPTIIDRIFEPYYTTKEVGKGTGMGLSVVHGIVKRHGGGIRVESELGKGTIFEIYFPALEETAEEKKEPEGEIKGGPERILFVDDEESLVGMNHQRLERLGYQVKSTTKPLEALEWFKTEPNQFDVVITDMTMPRMTGDKLAAEVLKIRPHMPVIICTGYSERMSAKKAEGLGVRKYLEKPIGLRNMASALREVLDDGPMSAVPT